MSRSLRRRLAEALGRHLVEIMPQGRADWAAGMQAEIEAIDDPAGALGFAIGCVRAGYGQRLHTLSGVLAAVRWSIAATTMLFAVLVLTNGYGLLTQGGPARLALVFAALGLAFLAAGLTLARIGPGGLAIIATAMLALNSVGLWVTHHAIRVHADVYRALVFEGYLLWTMLLLAGLTLRGAARSRRLAALAQARGWAR